MRTLLLLSATLATVSACDCNSFFIDGEPPGLDGSTEVDAGACMGPVRCYSFDAGVPGTGACQSGAAQCIDGMYGPCSGDVGPSTEACNGIDDDCNGIVDDRPVLGDISCGLGVCKRTVPACIDGGPTTCLPGPISVEVCDSADNNCDGVVDEGCNCVYVSALYGSDGGAGTVPNPLRTIAQGIALAADGGFDGGVYSVCVGGGRLIDAGFCQGAAYNEAVEMSDGISVLGGWEESSNAWVRTAGCATRITARDDRGVHFGSSVVTPTSIDGFVINASNGANNAAITVEGSRGALITNNVINGGLGQVSVGVNVVGGSTPTVSRNAITGGSGAQMAIGVNVEDSKAVVSENCSIFDNRGRCDRYCGNTVRFIRGRLAAAQVSGADSFAVRMERAGGTVIDRSSLCSGAGNADVAGVRILGHAKGTVVRRSMVEAFGGAHNAVGVWADDCAAESPWIFDNFNVQGGSAIPGSRADGVRIVGDCHARIDSNSRIIGGQEASQNEAIGVYCALNRASGAASQCTVQNNTIFGSAQGVPPSSTGVKCDRGACALIESNRIDAVQGIYTYGVTLVGARTVVRKNVISGGCARYDGVGLLSVGSSARVENNEIRGGFCAAAVANPLGPEKSYGVLVLLGPGAGELDLHSNTINGYGTVQLASTCASYGIAFDVGDAGTPSGPGGIVRNNIVEAGVCLEQYAFAEASSDADPRLFESNNLWSASDGGLYFDEAMTPAPVPPRNISADPQYDPRPDAGIHLGAGSPCINAGTKLGAPPDDFEGDSRSQGSEPDIGADEYVP